MANTIKGAPIELELETPVTNPLPGFAEEEFEIEIVDPAAPQKEEATIKLEQQMAEQQALIEKLQNEKAQAAPPANDMDKLADLLSQRLGPVPTGPTEPTAEQKQQEYLKLVEGVRQNFHADPTGNVLKLIEPVLQQVQEQNQEMIQKQSLKISELSAYNSPDAPYMQKYGDEVRQLVATLPPSGNVYQQALAQVKVNHTDDIIAERVQAALDEALAKARGQEVTPAEVQQQAPFSLATQQGTPAAASIVQKQKVQVSIAEQNKLKQFAMNHMLSWDNPQHQNLILKQYKEGSIRI